MATKTTTPSAWVVNGVSRAAAYLVSRDAEDRPAYGGTPTDFSVVQAIQELKARGLRVTFYPFLLMDVPPGNTLPNPYSTMPPALASRNTPGAAGSPVPRLRALQARSTRPPAAATQVAAFFGAATPGNFACRARGVTGPARPATGACAG